MTILTHPAVTSQSSSTERASLMLMKARSVKNYRTTKLLAVMTTSSQSKTVPSWAVKTSPQKRIKSNSSRPSTNTSTTIDSKLIKLLDFKSNYNYFLRQNNTLA